ncbi:MAG: 1-acyl-sn-glycerol-3-phosphate acyltransferase, partial [Cyanobium sp.]
LEVGWASGVFRVGSRQRDGRVDAPQAGAALRAARAGVPLLPVAIINRHRALGPGGGRLRLVPVHIRIGTPIAPPPSRRRPDLEAATAACQQQINALLEQGLVGGSDLLSARVPDALPPSGADHDP